MGSNEWEWFKQLLSGFLITFIYPLIYYIWKNHSDGYSEMQKRINDHETRLAVNEAQIKNVNDDIKEIKDSIDKLPDRIKSDIKDLLKK